MISQINSKAGEAECEYYKKRLSYLYENQNEKDVSRSRILHCHGELKNNKGQVSMIVGLLLGGMGGNPHLPGTVKVVVKLT